MFKQFYCFLFIFLLAHHSKCAKKLSPDFQNNVDDLSKQFAFNVDDLIKLDQSFEKNAYDPSAKAILGTLLTLLHKYEHLSPTKTITSVSFLSMIYTAYEIDRLSLVWDSIKNAENIIFEGELRLEKIQERMNKLHNDLNEQTQLLLDYDKTSDIKERQAMEDKIDYLTKKMHTTCLGTREVLEKLNFKINGATVSIIKAKNSQVSGIVWSFLVFGFNAVQMAYLWSNPAVMVFYKGVMVTTAVVSSLAFGGNVVTYTVTQDTLRQLGDIMRQLVIIEVELDEVFLKIEQVKIFNDYVAKTNLRNQDKSDL